VGHVQMNFIVNQPNLSLPDSEIRKLSELLVWNILMGWWNSWDGNNKGRLLVTYHGPPSDLHTIVER